MIHLRAIATGMPDRVVENSFFPGLDGTKSKMFLGSRERRHVARDEGAVELFEKAFRRMEADLGRKFGPTDFPAIFTNVSLPDMPFTGSGAILAQRLQMTPELVLDLHNGGCVSFIVLLEFARDMMKARNIKNALIFVAQTAAGRIFAQEKIRQKPQAAIPGDGAAVAWVSLEGNSPVDPIIVRCHPDYASDMTIRFDDDRRYWEATTEPGYIDFPEEKAASILMRGNRLVPAVMKELLAQAQLRASDIDGLVTNQPNTFFLRNWREAIQLRPEQHFQTFDKYANLFQAGIPVSLGEAINEGKIKRGSKILLAGFSHAGDYSAAALLTWGGS